MQGSAIEVIKRRVIVAHPILDFSNVLAAGDSMATIRQLAIEEELDAAHGVTVRITGNPALNYEEMIGLAWDLGLGGVVCFFFVIAVLVRALRSIKLVIAAVTTLLIGLVITAAFAAAAVGHLSLVSASFAVLFIGLGVDFAIHLGMAYASRLRLGCTHDRALQDAAESVGSSLVICTFTTAIGFYVFVPTDYLGVAELGLIAGSGMFIILILTLTLFPALLSLRWLSIDAERDLAKQLSFRTTWWRVFETHPRAVLVLAGMLFVCGLALIPRARFDVNVVEMRDATTESVQAFDDLLAQSGAMSPWFINSVAADLDAAQPIAAKMRALDSVSHTLTLADFVPEDQEEKLEILADLAFLLDVPPVSNDTAAPLPFDQQVAALEDLHRFLSELPLREADDGLAGSIRVLRDKLGVFLERAMSESAPEESIAKLDELLLSGFPDQIARMRAAIETDEITLEGLPPELAERMIARDGRARIQIFPLHDLSDEVAFTRFTDQVQAVDPKAAGVAINLVAFGRATRSSFRQALVSAVVIVSTLLFLLWRRVAPMLLVMAPLTLSSVLTVAAMVLIGIPFNFGNVIVIPLLLGIGVDSGIHLVHRAEQLRESDDDLMDSTTARAVFYSALTTTISFGTLAFSSHRGLASLGVVLSIGMVLTVFCNLIVLPSLLRVGGLGRGASESDDPAKAA
jgi:hopanoid biosynthesis associated RND transporter like protein HpnN